VAEGYRSGPRVAGCRLAAAGRRVLLRTGGKRDHAFAPRFRRASISKWPCSRTGNACAPACCRAICCCRKASLSEAAIDAWQRIEQQDPAYLALVAQRLLETYRKLERRDEGIALLSGYLERYPSLDLLDAPQRRIRSNPVGNP
jgi:tetratricopeptide (TPR) repeat protein